MTELRKFHRTPSSLEVELIYQGRCHRGCLGNISLSGALAHLHEHADIGPGQLCLLRMRIPGAGGETPPLAIWCEAVHCSALVAGVRFVGCDDQATRLLSLLMQQMKDKPENIEEDLARIRAYLADYNRTG
ncbi:MAG TPA: PilZ domain-containing protein [Geobacter sp.]|nr:PilZ domain-containing protein [Geobacter sp.]